MDCEAKEWKNSTLFIDSADHPLLKQFNINSKIKPCIFHSSDWVTIHILQHFWLILLTCLCLQHDTGAWHFTHGQRTPRSGLSHIPFLLLRRNRNHLGHFHGVSQLNTIIKSTHTNLIWVIWCILNCVWFRRAIDSITSQTKTEEYWDDNI